jgi:hypothetical protein
LFILFPIVTIFGYSLNNYGAIKIDEFSILISDTFLFFSSLSITEILEKYIYFPILELNMFSTLSIAYTEFALKDIQWGLVGIEHLLSDLMPSFLFDREFSPRYYYQIYADQALRYHVDYSFLTFTFQQEMILGFGLHAVLIGMFFQGILINLIFYKFNNYNSPVFFRIIYIGLFYRFSFGFNSGLLTSDMTTPLRVIIYACIFYAVINTLKIRKFKYEK